MILLPSQQQSDALPIILTDFQRKKHEIFTSEIKWSIHLDWIDGWQRAAQTNMLKTLVDDCVAARFDALLKLDDGRNLINYCSAFNQEVQRKTLYSIADFLTKDKSEDFLMVLFYCVLGVYLNKIGESFLDRTIDAYPWVLMAVLRLLSIIRWAEAAHAMQASGSFTPRQQVFVLPKLSVPLIIECYQLWSSANISANSKLNWMIWNY